MLPMGTDCLAYTSCIHFCPVLFQILEHENWKHVYSSFHYNCFSVCSFQIAFKLQLCFVCVSVAECGLLYSIVQILLYAHGSSLEGVVHLFKFTVLNPLSEMLDRLVIAVARLRGIVPFICMIHVKFEESFILTFYFYHFFSLA